MDYALGGCDKSHDHGSEFDTIYEIHSDTEIEPFEIQKGTESC